MIAVLRKVPNMKQDEKRDEGEIRKEKKQRSRKRYEDIRHLFPDKA
jgi:hypothetical protein